MATTSTRPLAALALAAIVIGAAGTTRLLTSATENPATAGRPTVSPSTSPTASSGGRTPIAPLTLSVEGPVDVSDIGAAVIPSVVTVDVGGEVDGELVRRGSGSGVVYDAANGYVLSNEHVVSVGDEFRVTLADGRVYEADLVGADESTDIAVLRISATNLSAVTIGTTQGLTVGQPAIAVGSPLGLTGGPSLTVGVLSALGREVQVSSEVRLFGMLQTDAPIISGSSGGALVDAAGRLIGITTAIGVSEAGAEGIGFATPVDIVTRVADEIIATGRATQPLLGITGTTGFTDLDDGGQAPTGVRVVSVEPDTAAESAGLQEDDLITAVDGVKLDTMEELVARLRAFAAGDGIELTVVRGSEELTITLELGDR